MEFSLKYKLLHSKPVSSKRHCLGPCQRSVMCRRSGGKSHTADHRSWELTNSQGGWNAASQAVFYFRVIYPACYDPGCYLLILFHMFKRIYWGGRNHSTSALKSVLCYYYGAEILKCINL